MFNTSGVLGIAHSNVYGQRFKCFGYNTFKRLYSTLQVFGYNAL